VLTEEQYSLLRSLSEERGKAVSALIREAIEQIYVQGVNRQRREVAVERLLTLEAPVAKWEQKEDIARGALDG
jgi:predicted DNA-binding protein